MELTALRHLGESYGAWPRLAGQPGSAPLAAEDADLAALLATFEPIGLTELTGQALLNRSELKYVMPQAQLPSILRQLRGSYRVLAVAGRRLSHYRTLYFDTPDLLLYRRHHNGVPDRYKVRAREYVDSHTAFFDIKHRTPNQRTLKSRMATSHLLTNLGEQAEHFLADACPYRAGDLQAALWNYYSRITLVSKTRAERVTLDQDLTFAWGEDSVALPGVVVAEVKYEGSATASEFVQLMRLSHVRGTSFSKYCVGISLLYPQVKHNKFKAKQRLVARLAQGASYGLS